MIAPTSRPLTAIHVSRRQPRNTAIQHNYAGNREISHAHSTWDGMGKAGSKFVGTRCPCRCRLWYRNCSSFIEARYGFHLCPQYIHTTVNHLADDLSRNNLDTFLLKVPDTSPCCWTPRWTGHPRRVGLLVDKDKVRFSFSFFAHEVEPLSLTLVTPSLTLCGL